MTANAASGAAPLRLSVVAPCHNEEESLAEFHRRTAAAAVAAVGHELRNRAGRRRLDGRDVGGHRGAVGGRPPCRRRPADAQPRPPARGDGGPRRGARRTHHADRRRPAGSARAATRHDGADGPGRRRGLRPAPEPGGRELVQDVHGGQLLSAAVAARQRQDPAGHRRFPADDPARGRRAAGDARARALHPRHGQLDRRPAGAAAVRARGALRRDDASTTCRR